MQAHSWKTMRKYINGSVTTLNSLKTLLQAYCKPNVGQPLSTYSEVMKFVKEKCLISEVDIRAHSNNKPLNELNVCSVVLQFSVQIILSGLIHLEAQNFVEFTSSKYLLF